MGQEELMYQIAEKEPCTEENSIAEEEFDRLAGKFFTG